MVLLGLRSFWCWNAWCTLELSWILLEFSWATATAEEVSLAFVVGKHLCLGGLFNVDLVRSHDCASDFLWCFLGERRKHESGSRERKNYFFHIQIPNVTKVTYVQYIHNAVGQGIVPIFLTMKIKFLHTNDFHGKLGTLVFEQLSSLRKECDFYFDSGDAIKSGNLAIPMSVDPVWARLSSLNCSASVLGNRETHPLRMALEKKLQGHQHPVLAGNLEAKDGSDFLPKTLVLQKEGFKIGVISTMVAMVTARMKTQAASAFLWSDPIETAMNLARELRPRVDLLVALTHIGYRQDVVLAQKCPDIDITFGGHSHTVLEEPVRENHTWIVQGGSHGRFAGVYEWEAGVLTGGLIPLQTANCKLSTDQSI